MPKRSASGSDVSKNKRPANAEKAKRLSPGSESLTNNDSLENKNDTGWKLQLEKHPPDFPFHETYFSIQVYLVDESGKLVKSRDGSTCVPLDIALVSAEDKTPIISSNSDSDAEYPVIEIQGGFASIGNDGRSDINVKVLELSSYHENRSFRLKISPQDGATLPRSVEPVFSKEMKVVSHRLVVGNDTPRTWYKDQGGRENCIEVLIKLEGPKTKQLSEDVPLNVSLVYDDYSKVRDPKGEILNVHADSVLTITPQRMETLIKFRVEDVSKNHQSKGFRFLVEPKRIAHRADIARVLTNPILVKSKVARGKNKRRMNSTNGEMSDPYNAHLPFGSHSGHQFSSGYDQFQKEIFQANSSQQILQYLPNATPSGAVRIPPSALPHGPRYEATMSDDDSTRSSATHAAAWCDAIKDALFELQQISVRRLVVENKLWKLLGDYQTILPFLQEQVRIHNHKIAHANAVHASHSVNTLPSLSSSTAQLISGLSSEIYGDHGSSSVSQQNHSMMLLGNMNSNMHNAAMSRSTTGLLRGKTDDFLAAAGQISSTKLMREHSLLEPPTHQPFDSPHMDQESHHHKRHGVVDQLLQEYENTKT